MKMIDLSHSITEDMPLFPGSRAPRLERILVQGCKETNLNLNSHLGTHVDAPAHTEENGACLDALPVDRFFGLCQKLDVSQFRGGSIPKSFLEEQEATLACCKFLALHSGYDQHWGEDAYFDGYPTLSEEAAQYLAEFEELSGVAMDMVSADVIDSRELPIHHILLGSGKLIIENLCNLHEVIGELFLLSALPLQYPQADASPLRAVAFQAPTGVIHLK